MVVAMLGGRRSGARRAVQSAGKQYALNCATFVTVNTHNGAHNDNYNSIELIEFFSVLLLIINS